MLGSKDKKPTTPGANRFADEEPIESAPSMLRPEDGTKPTEQPYLDRVGGKKKAQNCQNITFLIDYAIRLASCEYP